MLNSGLRTSCATPAGAGTPSVTSNPARSVQQHRLNEASPRFRPVSGRRHPSSRSSRAPAR
jgi:hypothetical protein